MRTSIATGGEPRLLLLDVDGTLIDSQHSILTSMAAACAAVGVPAPADAAVRRIIGLSLDRAMEILMPTLADAVRAQVTEAYKDQFAARRSRPDHHEAMFPGVLEALEQWQAAGFLMSLATGKSRRGTESVIAMHGLGRFLSSIHTADDGPGKPHPAMILAALSETGVDPARAVMIGDTSFDMLMADAAGVAGIGVTWGYHSPAELTAAGARVIVEDTAALRRAVETVIPLT